MTLEHDKAEYPFADQSRPEHIAIIMDGNGRWAANRGKLRAQGHLAGAEAVRRVVRLCRTWKIPYLTLYAFSTENWSRPSTEVSALMRLFSRFLESEKKELREVGVRLNHIGDLSRLSPVLRDKFAEVEEYTSGGKELTLTLAVNYGGRDEIIRAVRSLAVDAAAGNINPDTIDMEAFSGRLDTSGLPDPDLLIRTAGEMRWSNFLLWQAAYAEFFVTSACWPDFGEEHLIEAIRSFQSRKRKFGALAAEEAN